MRAFRRFQIAVPLISIAASFALSAQAQEQQHKPPPQGQARPAASTGRPGVAPGQGQVRGPQGQGARFAHGNFPARNFGGHPYHGRQAADGEIYDMETMVAAHRTLPFQTWVRVYDLDNNKTVEVRIIDRGPFVDGRIIDLSHAAARAIDMIGPGIARVRMEVIGVPASVTPAIYVVQLGAFESRAIAEQVQAGLAEHYGTTRVIQRKENPGIWRLLVGNEANLEAANALCDRILRETGEKKAFAVRLDPQ